MLTHRDDNGKAFRCGSPRVLGLVEFKGIGSSVVLYISLRLCRRVEREVIPLLLIFARSENQIGMAGICDMPLVFPGFCLHLDIDSRCNL